MYCTDPITPDSSASDAGDAGEGLARFDIADPEELLTQLCAVGLLARCGPLVLLLRRDDEGQHLAGWAEPDPDLDVPDPGEDHAAHRATSREYGAETAARWRRERRAQDRFMKALVDAGLGHDERWSKPAGDHLAVIVLRRRGRVVLGPDDLEWDRAAYYGSNRSGTHWADTVLVTEHGWRRSASWRPRHVAASTPALTIASAGGAGGQRAAP